MALLEPYPFTHFILHLMLEKLYVQKLRETEEELKIGNDFLTGQSL